MKTEREIRQMTQAVTGAAILQEQAGGPAAEHYAVAAEFLRWTLGEWKPDWGEEDMAGLRRVAEAAQKRRRHRDN